ncbi:MFS transporter [Pseudonocardia kunmingensis]|uniref:Polyol permease family n=1 Tax=Pseudonocardia kunmingensis TaxID=630975 RepID=A0A543C1Z4_9PSEU|nr:MFS transporter [Pseudonocardia kunmingensis]TQL91102.1 polyol permease family [Pseudonocardia kunmingensis]
MNSGVNATPRTGRLGRFLDSQGIARPLAWGYVGLTLFMVGDGIEQGFLAPYLDELGFSAASIAALFSAYGVVVAVSAWLAGALAEAWGPRRVMLIGAALWVVLEVAFLVGVMQHSYTLMITAFAVRAVGYPFFAYGFLVWVTMDTPDEVMGKAVGWYWFANAMGLGVISAYFAGLVIPLVGELVTLWLTIAFVAAGALIIATLVTSRGGRSGITVKDTVSGLVQGVTIIKDVPRVGIGGMVRLINTISFYAFAVFLSVHMVNVIGFSLPQWQAIWGTMLAANVAANLLAGYASDRVGRINVIAWGGGIGTAVSVLALYYVPEAIGPNFAVVMAIGIVYGLALGMYVPLSAVVPLLAPRHKASAVAVLNLGAGLSNFGGPLLAGLVGPLGIAPVVWILAGLYVVGFFLTYGLRQPGVEVTTS